MKKIGRIIRNNLSFIITFAVITLLLVTTIFVFGVRVVTVDGPSMDTTLESGEKLIITNFNYTPKTGDIIVKVGEVEVGHAGTVSTLIGEYKAGDTVAITLRRGDETLTVNVTLGSYSKSNL